MQVDSQLSNKNTNFLSAVDQLVRALATGPEDLRGLVCSDKPSAATLVSIGGAVLRSDKAPLKLKESATNAVVAGIVAGTISFAQFYELFKAGASDTERAMQFGVLCRSVREGGLAQGLLQEVFFAAAATDRDQVSNIVSRYVLAGYPCFNDWYSVASALQRNDGAEQSILAQLLSQTNRQSAARAAGIVMQTLCRIDTGAAYESARLLLASSFLKCRGLVISEDTRIDSAIKSSIKTLLFSGGAPDTFSAIVHGTILTSKIEVALALIESGACSAPGTMARILSVSLDRRSIAQANGHCEDLEGSKTIAMAAGNFLGTNNSVRPMELYQFLRSNRELITPDAAANLEVKLGSLLCSSKEPNLVVFVNEIMAAAPPSLLPAIANYLGRFGNEERHLNWLLERSVGATSDAAGYVEAVAALSSRFLISRDSSKIRSARAAIKRLRDLRRSRKSYRRLKKVGGDRSLNRSLESIDSAPGFKKLWDFMVRSTVGIVR